MGPQSCKSPNFGNFGTLTWESQDKMSFGCWPRGHAQSILWGGRWWLPPSPGRGEFCESEFAPGSSVHQKCSNYALSNLFFGLCKSVWVIEMLVNLLNHIPKLQHTSLPPKCYEQKNVPQLPTFPLFSS